MTRNLLILLITLVATLYGCGGGDETPAAPGNTSGTGNTGNQTASAPVLRAIGDKSVAVNTTLSFTVRADDANGDAITYSAEGYGGASTNPFQANPPASLDESTGRFSWTPAQTGDYDVTFIATDNSAGALSDDETITLSVYDPGALGQIQLGAQLYADNCQSCHGVNGSGGSRSSVVGALAITITEAIDGNVGAMSSLSSLSAADIEAIAAFLQSL